MVERQAIARLNREFILLQKTDCSQFVARPSENDTLTWHYCIFNLPYESPYYGGQYHGKLVFPREYPLKPPSILMLTPSGRFEVNTRLCLSMSDFHPETWNPSWRVETILLGLVSFMCDEAEPVTAGGVRSSKSVRQNDALLSFFRNRRSRDFCLLFPDLIDPAKYIIGVGFMRSIPSDMPPSFRPLESLSFSDNELSHIASLDDLTNLIKSKGVEIGPLRVDKGNNPDKTVLNAAPWFAIIAISSIWIFSQLRS